jgi:hypothetical protein
MPEDKGGAAAGVGAEKDPSLKISYFLMATIDCNIPWLVMKHPLKLKPALHDVVNLYCSVS